MILEENLCLKVWNEKKEKNITKSYRLKEEAKAKDAG